MSAPMINVEGPKGLSVESAVALAGTVTEILQVAADTRTPEAVTLAALRVVESVSSRLTQSSVAINGCNLDARTAAGFGALSDA